MSRRGRAIHRADLTAKGLIQIAKDLGCQYHPQDGTVDGVLWLPDGRLVEVDWKGTAGDLTPAQTKLVAQGWHISFISTRTQVERLLKG